MRILSSISSFPKSLSNILIAIAMGCWLGVRTPLFAFPQGTRSEGPLKIVDVLFEDYDGWSTPRMTISAGGEVVLNFRLEGFERLEGRDTNDYPEYQVRLKYDVEIRDPQGVLVSPVVEGGMEPVLSAQDDTWRPLVRWSVMIPEWAPPGDYPIHIRIRDNIGDQQAEHTAVLTVRGTELPAANRFQAQGIQFARTPDGPWTSTRYFALRDPVYVRFNVVGYRISPDNRVWVEQDWTVLDEQGRVIIHQANVVQDQSQEFYPPRFLSTNFRLEVEDPQPGAYKLQIALRDRIGDQTDLQEVEFNLRP